MKGKIIHIISHFDLGGAERVALNIAKSKSENFQYNIIEVVKGDSQYTAGLISEMNENGIVYHRSKIKNKKIAILLFPFTFLFQYLKLKPTIVHTHTEIPDLSFFLFSKLFFFLRIKTRVIRTIHNTELWNNWAYIGRHVENFYIEKKANISISKAVSISYEKKYGYTPSHIVYNGVSVLSQMPFPGLVPGKINVLFAGRFEYQKGIDELIAIIKSLQGDDRFFFHLVGNGSMENLIRNELDEIHNIKIYATVYNISQYMQSFDCLLMPSRFEGLPLLAVEAALNKLPIIINNCAGLNEVVPNDWVLLVEKNTVKDYVYILKEQKYIFNRVQLCNQLYDFASIKFSLKVMQDGYSLIYNRKINTIL